MLTCPSVSTWLAQFPEQERPLAVLTLEHLHFVTTDEVKQDLSAALADAVDASIRAKSKILIESVLSKEDLERFLSEFVYARSAGVTPLKANDLSSVPAAPVDTQQKIQMLLGPITRRNKPTRSLYGDYYPSEIRDEESGSEKYLDLVIRNEYSRIRVRTENAKVTSPIIKGRDAIAALCDSDNVIDLILLTDNIGSGQQIIDFLGSILLSSIIGPLNSNQINIKVIAWTATSKGIAAVHEWASGTRLVPNGVSEYAKENKISLQIEYLRNTKSFLEIDDECIRAQLLSFFARYGDPKKKKPSRGLGFNQTASRTVMLGSSCPNNVPDFLYIPAKSISYRPLLESKIVPTDLADYILDEYSVRGKAYKPDTQFLEALRTQKLVQAANRSNIKEDTVWRIMLFAMAGFSKSHALRSMEISYFKFHQALSVLIKLEWVTADFVPTSKGSSLVKTYGLKGTYSDFASAKRYLKRHVDGRDTVYYPQSLRGVR